MTIEYHIVIYSASAKNGTKKAARNRNEKRAVFCYAV